MVPRSPWIVIDIRKIRLLKKFLVIFRGTRGGGKPGFKDRNENLKEE